MSLGGIRVSPDAIGVQVKTSIHETTYADELEFRQAVGRSASLHGDWVQAPADSAAFQNLLAKCRGGRNLSYLARLSSGELVGCVNLNEIVRGAFQSAYLGSTPLSRCRGGVP